MRYEVRTINTGEFGGLIIATDDARIAKSAAQAHCEDSYYGTAILDMQAGTVDLGDRVCLISEAFSGTRDEN